MMMSDVFPLVYTPPSTCGGGHSCPPTHLEKQTSPRKRAEGLMMSAPEQILTFLFPDNVECVYYSVNPP